MNKYLGVFLALFIVVAGCNSQPYLHVQTAPVSDFEADVREGEAPLTVAFTDLSTGDVTDWHWDFGDGQFSNNPKIVHTYSADGRYTVSLAIKGPGGSDVETKADFIRVGDTKSISDSTIAWSEAGNYIGQTKVVEGTIVETYYASKVKGQPTFLDFHIPYQDYFKCLIWGSDRPKFTREFNADPETFLKNKHVKVNGLIEEYPKGSGVPEMILDDPSQIEIIGK